MNDLRFHTTSLASFCQGSNFTKVGSSRCARWTIQIIQFPSFVALLAIAYRDGFAASHLFHMFSPGHQEEAFELLFSTARHLQLTSHQNGVWSLLGFKCWRSQIIEKPWGGFSATRVQKAGRVLIMILWIDSKKDFCVGYTQQAGLFFQCL